MVDVLWSGTCSGSCTAALETRARFIYGPIDKVCERGRKTERHYRCIDFRMFSINVTFESVLDFQCTLFLEAFTIIASTWHFLCIGIVTRFSQTFFFIKTNRYRCVSWTHHLSATNRNTANK